MREIKFRGKHIHASIEPHNTRTWVYGYLENKNIINSEELEGEMLVDENTVGQYTGVKDENGTEIYEGDIVKAVIIKQFANTPDDYEEITAPIVFEQGEFLIKNSTTAFGPTFHHLRLCKKIEKIR